MEENDDFVTALSKDLRDSARGMTPNEARHLVDTYYSMQEQRIRCEAQIREMEKSGEPHAIIKHLAANSRKMEKQVETSLDVYTYNHPVGYWARQQKGIGPVLSAGLLAHIDITKAPTVGHIWRFAGLDPTVKWEKGKKRPWNATLKTLCWKIGESFVWNSNESDGTEINEKTGKPKGKRTASYYGLVYKHRKAWETEQNEAGAYKDQAAAALTRFKFRDGTNAKEVYETGKLPPAHIHRRAARYATKLFLSHLHEVWYRHHFKVDPPKPYAIDILGHGHYLPPPEAAQAAE